MGKFLGVEFVIVELNGNMSLYRCSLQKIEIVINNDVVINIQH
jgi:hypothetical protein